MKYLLLLGFFISGQIYACSFGEVPWTKQKYLAKPVLFIGEVVGLDKITWQESEARIKIKESFHGDLKNEGIYLFRVHQNSCVFVPTVGKIYLFGFSKKYEQSSKYQGSLTEGSVWRMDREVSELESLLRELRSGNQSSGANKVVENNVQ